MNMFYELRILMYFILSFVCFGLEKVVNDDLSKDKLNKYLLWIE